MPAKFHYINYLETLIQFIKGNKMVVGPKTKIKKEKGAKIKTLNLLILNCTQFPTYFFKNSLLYMFKNSHFVSYGNKKTRVYSGFIIDIRENATLKIGGGQLSTEMSPFTALNTSRLAAIA